MLFVFSDPGGAKPCLALAGLDAVSDFEVVSDRHYPFYSDFAIAVQQYSGDAISHLRQTQPDLLFTGTSYTSSLEKDFLRAAANAGIPSVSFIDHWTSMRKRFETDDATLRLPGTVWVIDEQAKSNAVADGIPPEKIVISGNPYHEWLKSWRPDKSKEDVLSRFQLSPAREKMLLFAPDPLSNVDGHTRFGFDETDALDALRSIFNEFADQLNDTYVVVKPHPNQNVSKLNALVSGHPAFVIAGNDADTNALIYYSEAVIGFFSSLLIEATILEKPVFRFLITSGFKDPFAGKEIGIRVDRAGLAEALTTFSYVA